MSRFLLASFSLSLLLPLSGIARAQSSQFVNRAIPPVGQTIGMAPGVAVKDVSLIATPLPPRIQRGELITILVDENIQQNAISRVNRRRDVQEQLTFNNLLVLLEGLRLRNDAVIRSTRPRFDVQSLNNLRNQIQAVRQDTLRLQIQASVAEIKPNGNLMLEAHGEVSINNDVHVYSLTGLIDPRDVDPRSRSVKSSKVANKLVQLRQIGSVRDATRRGWFTKLVDMVRPL
jgi:flagellar L-ring protein precursor FlgH